MNTLPEYTFMASIWQRSIQVKHPEQVSALIPATKGVVTIDAGRGCRLMLRSTAQQQPQQQQRKAASLELLG